MSTLRVLSRRGDDRVAWDAQRVEAGGREALAAVRGAERVVRKQCRAGATAFRVERERVLVRLDTFDPTAEQIVMVPRLVGG